MSDTSQGAGWWMASDGKWYPPESAPDRSSSRFGPTGDPVVYQRPSTVNGLAIAGMVLGIIWCYFVGSILALIFGYISRRQIDESDGAQTGRGFAVAAIALGWVGVGFLILGIIVVAVDALVSA